MFPDSISSMAQQEYKMITLTLDVPIVIRAVQIETCLILALKSCWQKCSITRSSLCPILQQPSSTNITMPLHQTILPIPKLNLKWYSIAFNEKWLVKIGLQVTHKNPENKKMVTLSCGYCQEFGSKNADTQTKLNKWMATVKRWNAPFALDHMCLHVNDPHV